MKTVHVVEKPEITPCPNCEAGTRDQMDCLVCGTLFCGACFLDDPDGDGSTIRCPNTKCLTILAFPKFKIASCDLHDVHMKTGRVRPSVSSYDEAPRSSEGEELMSIRAIYISCFMSPRKRA